ncbi:helix-turn-helix domain-containing protein [Rhizohabitans arisaemae]|uniref:helix-turn-helix domain-containing protein n=1 Tax=Rhizohabitans arisaemae TaxID=2720610 RepID=UPI0024B170E4|nr:helix-turn-helix transcriptional regulator [Rhizohabitans arisaemae]
MITARAEEDGPVDSLLSQSQGGGPTVLRILLGAQLRRLRRTRGITREEAGHAIRGSHAKISRLELGRVGFKERDVADLLTLYGVVDNQEREALLTLARQASTPGWWHKYSDVLPSWFGVYVGLEEAASLIRTFEIQFIPGLLQTEDYARAVIMLGHRHAPREEIERRIRLRMQRQSRLYRDNPPRLWAIADEATLRRPVGGSAVMRAQIEHLLKVTGLPNITLQVLPLDRSGQTAANGPFSILRFRERELPDLIYLEQLTSALYLDKQEDTQSYLSVMDQLSLGAYSASETTEFLQSLLEEGG